MFSGEYQDEVLDCQPRVMSESEPEQGILMPEPSALARESFPELISITSSSTVSVAVFMVVVSP